MRRIAASMILCFLLAAFPLSAQVETEGSRRNVSAGPPFFIDVLTFAQQDTTGLHSRVDLYVKIPLELIQFVKQETGFTAQYSLTAILSDENGKRILEDSWERALTRSTFDATVAQGMSDITQRSYLLPPGLVMLEVIFEDGESKKSYRLNRAVHVKQFDPNLMGISDPMLVSRAVESGGKKVITPQVSPNIASAGEEFFVFYEIYNPFAEQRAKIRIVAKTARNPGIVRIESQELRRGRNSFITTLKTEDFDIGSYTFTVEVHREEDTLYEHPLATAQMTFAVEWLSVGTPLTINDVDAAIEQLRYFARSEDIDYIRNAPDPKEKRRRFEDFWERNNPTPGAKPNQRMVEYYNRVAYANLHFKHFIEGWKTDRGMVYIINGPPTSVDRHPFDVESKPYEIWEYTDINRRYIFIDESGFGDYRLLYPMWDDRNRIR